MSMHRAARPLAFVVFALAAAGIVPLAPAAENFVCGPGGTPDPKTSKCICPPGKIEKTTGGTSRCVDKPVVKPPPSTSTKPSATTTTAPPLPSTTTIPTTTAVPVPVPVPTATPVPVPVPVPTCGPGKVWNGVTCIDVASSAATCTDGKIPDAEGHCCWAGQKWIQTSLGQSCRGIPTCPPSMKVEGEACIFGACVDGQVRPDGAHCCWPGQAWSDADRACIGAPACPDGYQASGELCVPLRLCDPGMVAVDVEHCCWPGQHWMMRADGEVGCGGAPKCPSPLVTSGDDCMSPSALSAKEERDNAVSLWGAGYITLEVGLNLAGGNHSASWTNYDFSFAVKPPGTPFRFALGTFGGPVKYTSECADTFSCNHTAGDQVSTGVLGWWGTFAFAPFSIPNASTSSVSLINPWVGVTGRAWLVTGLSDTSDPAHLSSGGAVALSIGDVIMLGHFGVSFSFEPTLFGGDSRPSTWTRIAIAWVNPLF